MLAMLHKYYYFLPTLHLETILRNYEERYFAGADKSKTILYIYRKKCYIIKKIKIKFPIFFMSIQNIPSQIIFDKVYISR